MVTAAGWCLPTHICEWAQRFVWDQVWGGSREQRRGRGFATTSCWTQAVEPSVLCHDGWALHPLLSISRFLVLPDSPTHRFSCLCFSAVWQLDFFLQLTWLSFQITPPGWLRTFNNMFLVQIWWHTHLYPMWPNSSYLPFLLGISLTALFLISFLNSTVSYNIHLCSRTTWKLDMNAQQPVIKWRSVPLSSCNSFLKTTKDSLKEKLKPKLKD